MQMSSPDSLSLDNLVQLHQLKMNSGSQQVTQITPEAQQKAAVMNQRNEKLSIPKPIGVQPGASDQSPTKNVEDKMMDAMIKTLTSVIHSNLRRRQNGTRRKRNIFR